MTKPIHKFNNGNGATLCHTCTAIINIGFTEELFCKECSESRIDILEAKIMTYKKLSDNMFDYLNKLHLSKDDLHKG
jgi:DUF1680 family protein